MTDKKMNDGKLRFYDKGKETFAIGDPYWGKCQTPKTQLHIQEQSFYNQEQSFYNQLWELLETELGDTVLCDQMADRIYDLVKEHYNDTP